MIVAAAIRLDGRVYALPAPARHHDVIRWIVENTHHERVPGSADQGFIDSEMGFVGRVQAWDIAAHGSKQLLPIAPTDGGSGRLYSEDVW